MDSCIYQYMSARRQKVQTTFHNVQGNHRWTQIKPDGARLRGKREVRHLLESNEAHGKNRSTMASRSLAPKRPMPSSSRGIIWGQTAGAKKGQSVLRGMQKVELRMKKSAKPP
jgi:hypothetical protein